MTDDYIRRNLVLFPPQDGVEYMWRGVENMVNFFDKKENEEIIRYDNCI